MVDHPPERRMTPRRWQQIEALFEAVLEEAPEDRTAFLADACGDDQALREEVEALLEADAQGGDFLHEVGERLFTPTTPALPERIGIYAVDARIGQGGMGTVYRAHRADGAYEQEVAIKVLKQPDHAEHTQRFLAERQILARLSHPHIARLLDGGLTDAGQPYLVMEYVDGQPLTTYCDERRLSINERLALFCTVCDAVQYAHRNLVVHRDLKPSNILVTADGKVKLLDFGIAKLLDPDPGAFGQAMPVTKTGLQVLTPEYASPEQVTAAPITTASDVYQLGILLYELLTGQRPYRLPSRLAHEVVRVILEEEPTRPSTAVTRTAETGTRRATPDQLRRRLSGDLDVIVLAALRKEPERRYSSAEALAADVQRHLEGMPVEAHAESTLYRLHKFMGRHRWAVAAVLAFVMLLTAYGGTATY